MEYSGGLDSSSVLTALIQSNIKPALFMHVAYENSGYIDDFDYAMEVIKTFDIKDFYKINANEFDLIKVIQMCSKIYAGSPTYMFPIGMNNIHSAVLNKGYETLFSGFGGDECVSGHARISTCIKQYASRNNYKIAWNELVKYYKNNGKITPSKLKLVLQLIKHSHPSIFNLLNEFKSIPEMVQNYLHSIPYTKIQNNSKSIREDEYNLLVGKYSKHLRMRIEDSALIAKALGFNYKYPLLYPKLVEYCFNLPIEQKRLQGINRLIIRKYLSEFLPKIVYEKHQKIGSIMPATSYKIETQFLNGELNDYFLDLPYKKELAWLRKKYPQKFEYTRDITLLCIKLYMGNRI